MLTYEKYSCIKILLQGGASLEECAKTLNVNVSTVKFVKESQNFDEFKSNVRANQWVVKKQKEAKKTPEPQVQIVEHRQSVTIVANQYMAQELQKQTKLLELISNKLAFIVDELIGTEKKE